MMLKKSLRTFNCIISLLLGISCFSQTSLIKLIETQATSINSLDGSSNMMNTIRNEIIYYSNKISDFDQKDSILKIHTINILNQAKDSILFSFKGLQKNKDDYSFKDFAVSDHYIAFIQYSTINVFDIKTHKCIFSKEGASEDFNGVKSLSDDYFLFYNIYNYHPANCFPIERLRTIHFKNNKLVFSKTVSKKYSGIQFSIRIKNWVEPVNDKIFVANTLDYSIEVYNKQLDSLTTLKSTLPGNNNQIKQYLDSITNSRIEISKEINQFRKKDSNQAHINDFIESKQIEGAKDIFSVLTSLDSTIWRIEKIIPFGSKQFIVSKRCPNCNFQTRYLDVWDITTGKILIKDIHYENVFNDSLGTWNDFFPFDFTYSSKILNYQNHLIQYRSRSYLKLNDKNVISQKQFQHELNNYYADNDGFGSFFIYETHF